MTEADHHEAHSAGPAGWRTDTVVGVVILLALAVAPLYRAGPERLPEFGAIAESATLKSEFFAFLAPVVAAENERVLEQRRRLLEIAPRIRSAVALSPIDRRWLRRLAAEYELEWPGRSRADTLEALLRRVDIIPVPLALVQAAAESGWGRSRFAREGNNLFGQWCYAPGCGIVPARRSPDQVHEVAAFETVGDSVRRYLNNLNTHPSYRGLREIRARQRAAGQRPLALQLANGLAPYSERREAYVEDIRQMIRANRDLIDEAVEPARATTGV
ncbi:MAG: Bax protein [Pseudomonadota bacterium]|nr:MAG: Bax protein [Pseudomonadota bacterium]